MQACKLEAVIAEDGSLRMEGLPFPVGARVEVFVQIMKDPEARKDVQNVFEGLEIPEKMRPFFAVAGKILMDEAELSFLR